MRYATNISKDLNFQLKHPVIILLTAFALTVLSIWYTMSHLDFETSQKDLIYPENKLIKLSKAISPFNEYDTFVVVIENKNNARSLAFLHALVPLLKRDKKHFTQVFFRVNPEHFRRWALLYLKRKDLVTLINKISDHKHLIQELAASSNLTEVLSAINHEMASAMVGSLFTGFLNEKPGKQKKPMDLTFIIQVLKQMQNSLDGKPFVSPMTALFIGSSFKNHTDEGYFWTEGKRFLLFFVTPKATKEGFSDTLEALKRLRAYITQVRKSFPDIQVGVTGQEALNQDEMETAFNDMRLATILSLAGLALLLMIFWRGVRRPLLELIELIVALSWTFGLTTLFIGHLNILSITFAPLLLGLGIDYGIHFLARYQEGIQHLGQSREVAVTEALNRLGPSIILAGITAAISFFPLVLTGFKGLVELGEITSMGMIMTTITTLCLLPSLIILFDKKVKPIETLEEIKRPRVLFKLNTRAAVIILTISGVAFILSLSGARHITFDLNMLNLQSKGAESVVWEHKLLNNSSRSSMYGAMVADSLEQIREKTRKLKALSTVSEVQSILTMLPEHQEEKLLLLGKLKPVISGIKLARINNGPLNIKQLNNILGRIRFKMLDTKASDWGDAKPLAVQMRQVRKLIDGLRKHFQDMDHNQLERRLEAFNVKFMKDLQDKLTTLEMNLNTTPMQVKDLPLTLRKRYISKDGRYLIRIFPSGNIWEPNFLTRFVDQIRSVDPNAIGDPVTLNIFTRAFRNACIHAAIYAAIFIALLLLVTFRDLFQAFLVMTPLIIGTVWTLGVMDIFGVNFNLANSLFLPLIVGAGVEYGIIIMQRRKQEGISNEKTVLHMSTAKGVILAGLTTTVGFGTLTIAHHQGIASLGMLATIGSLCILTASVIFLPALMQVMRRPLNKRPSQKVRRETCSENIIL